MKTFRKNLPPISLFLVLQFILQLIIPTATLGLTSGPSQPETQQFSPAGLDNMVDPFTGDFSYNIPLLDVGGYPVNLNYAAGISPDAEASWVGLGWNLNVGAINRSVRGLPDDFAGDEISKDFNIKPNQTFGVSGNIYTELMGFSLKGGLGLSANLFYNNYNGVGMGIGVSPSLGAGSGCKSPLTAKLGLSTSLGSESGLEVTPTLGLKYQQADKDNSTTLQTQIGFPYSTREGLKGMSLSGSFNYTSSSLFKKGDNEGRIDKEFNRSTSAFQGFASPTYTPTLEHDLYNVNASLNLSLSVTNPGTENAIGFGGYYSGQFLKTNHKTSPAYGYMYSGIENSEDKLLDFNREKDGLYNQFTTNLALTNFTYDIFQVSGQGIGGTYRVHRGDVGAVHDPHTSEQGYSPSLGVEIGLGAPPSVKVGVDVNFNYTQNTSGKWPSANGSIRQFKSPNSAVNTAKEYAYFKLIGEQAPDFDSHFFENVQKGYHPIRQEMKGVDFSDAEMTDQFALYSQPTSLSSGIQLETIESNNFRQERRSRNTAFTTLTAKEAKTASLTPIYNYDYMKFDWGEKNYLNRSFNMDNLNLGYTKTEIKRDENGRKDHHVSEIRVTDNKGSRYVYGIPVYNTSQNEVTFALPQADGNDARRKGYVEYTPDVDDKLQNENGIDGYYNKVSTPPYATSYLLTAVLSSDYVDRDNIPGPSDGDLGSYTKFNYTRITDSYNWRTPLVDGKHSASFSEGLNSKNEDDKASYVYGTKEVWYLHSIETRTHVAEFHLMDREDGFGADKHGNLDQTKPLQALKKIVLYSKTDKYNSQAEPIKTVHFKYDYSLCPKTPNSKGKVNGMETKGKLTLKELWFTFGNSHKGFLNPYKFTYADQNFDGEIDSELNPDYNSQNADRWGTYKPNDYNRPNALFPYSVQDSSTAARHAAAYAMSSIKMPTGGTIRIYYEADDYAYVQNRQAMRMYRILGAVAKEGDSENGFLYNNDLNDKLFLVVDLEEGFRPRDASKRDDEFRQNYLSGMEMLYYRILQEVVSGSNHEYVPGYFEVDKQASKLVEASSQNGVYKKALVKIKPVNPQNGKSGTSDQMNPLVRNGWMFARLRLNRELMGLGNVNQNGLEQALRALLSMADNIKGFMLGFNEHMRTGEHSKRFSSEGSFLRLQDPDKKKYGGGHRVKAIVIEDRWDDMRSEKEKADHLVAKEPSYYGQVYDYTFNEGNAKVISAGVAAWEPMIGGDENPFRLPVFVREKVPLAPSKEYFLEEPFGESFFPAPLVGYRQCKVTPLKVTKEGLEAKDFKGNGTGFVQHEFYTAYDFPTITRRTELKSERYQPNLVLKFLKIDARDQVTCSQGYYVELNDMHGKSKAQRVFPEYTIGADNQKVENAPISEVEYRYFESTGRLESKVPYVGADLSIIENGPDLGVDVDVVEDERYSESTTIGGGLQVNVKYIQIGIIPIFVTTAFPDFNSEQTRFRSVVTTKVVNRTGILKSVTVKENGASITTENLVWDKKSGQVLLTKVQNEYDDPIFKFIYPAHWAYNRMGFASEQEGTVYNNFSSIKASVYDGAELATSSGLGYYIDSLGAEKVVSRTGDSIGISSEVKVIRSGARNMYNIPIGTIVSLKDPRIEGKLQFSQVLNASVEEYKEEWKRFCNCVTSENLESPFNWIVSGRKGNMRHLRSLTYVTGRTQTDQNNNLNIRKDGVLENFSPYWTYYTPDGKMRGISPDMFALSRWQYINQAENFNSTGLEIENKDALQRYSMAQFGYGRNQAVAVSNNSLYRESGFDGFEDYDIQDCEDDHLSWRSHKAFINNDDAHTGRKSIKVGKNSSLQIEKVIVPCNKPKVVPSPYSQIR